MSDYLESMRKIEEVIQERNIRWVYGSHNAILPGAEALFEATAFLEDVMSGKIDYTVKGGFRFYELNEFLSLGMAPE